MQRIWRQQKAQLCGGGWGSDVFFCVTQNGCFLLRHSKKTDSIFISYPKMSQQTNVKFKNFCTCLSSWLFVKNNSHWNVQMLYLCSLWKYLEPRCWIVHGLTTRISTCFWKYKTKTSIFNLIGTYFMMLYWSKRIYPVADPGIPRGGANPRPGALTYYSTNFPLKLHENEEILAGGARPPSPPPRSANVN